MPRRPLSEAEWRRSLQRRRMLDAERKRRLRENNAYRVLERTRNREARRRQRENPKFREAERARAHAYYMSLSSTATDKGIICGSCGLILKHVKALRSHRAEFHPRQRMSLDNIFKTPLPDVPFSIGDGSATDFSKLMINALKKEESDYNGELSIETQIDAIMKTDQRTGSAEHLLVDYYGIIFSDIEAAVERMLSCKLNKQRSYDLQTHLAIEAKLKEFREFVFETEKAIEKLATNGASSGDLLFDGEQKPSSVPSDLFSVLREFIFHSTAPAAAPPVDLLPEDGETGEEPIVHKFNGSITDESSCLSNNPGNE